VAFWRTGLGPAVDRIALLRFQHPPFELWSSFQDAARQTALMALLVVPGKVLAGENQQTNGRRGNAGSE